MKTTTEWPYILLKTIDFFFELIYNMYIVIHMTDVVHTVSETPVVHPPKSKEEIDTRIRELDSKIYDLRNTIKNNIGTLLMRIVCYI